MPSLAIRARTDLEAIPLGPAPVALLVAFSKFGYGHVSRCLKIARWLAEDGTLRPLVVSSQEDIAFSEGDDEFDHLCLPPYLYVGDQPPVDIPRTDIASSIPGLSKAELARRRSMLLTGIARRCDPAIIFLDSFPFHPKKSLSECKHLIRFIAARPSQTPIVAGFRGEMSRTYSESTYRRISQLIAAYTDRLLIFLDPTERGQTLARYPFLNSFEHLTDFVGFVGPPEVPKREPTKGYWLATFGGGIDAFQKIWVTCDAFRRLNADFPGAALHLYTGRRLPSSAMSSLQQEFGRTPRLHLRSYRPRLYEEFGKAELLIAMAGYNTCVEIASLATGPVIALPRVSSTNQEQLSNALRFRSSGHISEVLLPQELTGPRLAAVVRSVLSKGAGTRREINLGGAAAAGKALVALPAQVSH